MMGNMTMAKQMTKSVYLNSGGVALEVLVRIRKSVRPRIPNEMSR